MESLRSASAARVGIAMLASLLAPDADAQSEVEKFMEQMPNLEAAYSSCIKDKEKAEAEAEAKLAKSWKMALSDAIGSEGGDDWRRVENQTDRCNVGSRLIKCTDDDTFNRLFHIYLQKGSEYDRTPWYSVGDADRAFHAMAKAEAAARQFEKTKKTVIFSISEAQAATLRKLSDLIQAGREKIKAAGTPKEQCDKKFGLPAKK